MKKFFEQHDDPATTSGISDYVQKVRGTYRKFLLRRSCASRWSLPWLKL